MEITIHYSAIDGASIRRHFKTIENARRFAQKYEGERIGWRAEFTDVMYRYASSGYGDTPELATQDLMDRTVAY